MLNVNQILNQHLIPLLAGVGKVESRLTGGAKATGKVVFTANPSEGDTVTFGDTTITFMGTAVAATDVEIGLTLSATLDAAVTKLNGFTTGTVTWATYSKTDTNTALTATYDTYSAAGNIFPIAAVDEDAGETSNVAVTAMAGGVDGFLAEGVAVSYFTESVAADHQYFHLPVGQEGQRRLVQLNARTAAKNVVILPIGGLNASHTTLTLDAAGEYAELIFLNGKWRMLGGTATAS